jgi:tetratricopeptide (TPR) repeat protein
VVRAINEYVIPLQVSIQDPKSQPIIERYQQVWTPTILLLSPEGKVYHEWTGYLPPALYLSQLLLGLGKVALREHHFDKAAQFFDQVATEYPESDAAPEALYWTAVARYKKSGQSEDLKAGWQRLRERYPDSVWRSKQSFMEQ